MSVNDVLSIAVGEKVLVFGLDWLPLLGGNARHQAIARARRHRASHFVVASEHAAAMGMVQLAGSARRRGREGYSAAQALAALYPAGTVVLLVSIGVAQWWLVAVHEGAVIARTDMLFSDESQAQTIVAELRAAYAQVKYMSGPQAAEGMPGLSDLAGAADGRARLERVRRYAPVVRPAVWATVLAGGVGVVAFSGDLPSGYWTAEPSVAPMTAVSKAMAWDKARDDVAGRVQIHGVDGMVKVLASLYQVPVVVAGWRLRQTVCQPDASRWRCTGVYSRLDRHADNQGLMALLPSSWALRFPSVNSVEADWIIDAAALTLLNSPVDDARYSEKYWLSSLQKISAAFTLLKTTAATPVVVDSPTDEQGASIAKPAGHRGYQRRQIQAEGPLRSFSLLAPDLSGVRWHRLVLSVTDLDHPTLTQSRLHLSVQGERYEWQKSAV